MAQSFLWFKFDFHLFWCLVMNVNEFETKENDICAEDKIELQYLHQVVIKVNGPWKVLWQSQYFFERVLRLILLSSIILVVSEGKKPFQILEKKTGLEGIWTSDLLYQKLERLSGKRWKQFRFEKDFFTLIMFTYHSLQCRVYISLKVISYKVYVPSG